MPLSPADFYAYSQATGAPVADTPEKRAEQARDVYNFRQQQLKAPREESNIFDTLAKTALAAGTVAGGFGLYRALRNNPVRVGPTRSVAASSLQNIRRAATYAEPSPSRVSTSQTYERKPAAVQSATVNLNKVQKQIPTGTWAIDEEIQPTPDAADKFLVEHKKEYIRQKNLEQGQLTRQGYQEENSRQAKYAANLNSVIDNLILDIQTEPSASTLIARNNPQQFAQETLVQMQNAQGTDITSQSVAAMGSAEDQMTGRVKNQLQRNEDLDLGQIELLENHATQQHNAMMEEMDEPINSVARQLPDGLPMDQAEGLDLKQKAQNFLQQKFEELGTTFPGRYRRERVMGQDPQIAEAMELYASTGDPSVLSLLSKTPSSPLTVSPVVQLHLKDKNKIPTGMLYQPTGKKEFVGDLIENDIDLTNRISSLGLAKKNATDRLKQIEELELPLRHAGVNEPSQGGYYTRMLNKMFFEKQNLNPESYNADLSEAINQRNFVRSQMQSAEALGSQYELKPLQEGVRPFFEMYPGTNEINPETLEIRSGRRTVQSDEKTGGGRNYAMYDPNSQVGSSIGIYGIEPRNYPIADVNLRPTVLQREETKLPLRHGEFDGTNRVIRSTPQQKQSSLQISEAMRRANIEGRDPNTILRTLGFNL